MTTATIHQTKTHLSRLLRQVAQGEEIIILNGSVPVAKIVPLIQKQIRLPGSLRGKYYTPESFFDPLPKDELAGWDPGS